MRALGGDDAAPGGRDVAATTPDAAVGPVTDIEAEARAALRPVDNWVAITSVVIGIALTLAVRGYQFGGSNHGVYLVDALRKVDPTLLRNDWFTTQTLQYHGAFSVISTWLMRAGLEWLSVGFAAGYLLLVIALHAAWWAIVRALGGTSGAYVISVVAFYICSGGVCLGGYEIFQDSAFLPSNIAAVAMVCGVALILHGKLTFAGLCFGAAALFHLNYSIVMPVLWAALVGWWWMVDRHARPVLQWRGWLFGGLIVALAAGWNILPVLGRPESTPMPLHEFVSVYVKLRHPHHYDPLSWSPILWATFVLNCSAGFLLARLDGRWKAEPAWRRAAVVCTAVLVLLTIALFGAGIWWVSERLIQMSLWRFSFLLQLISSCVIGVYLWNVAPVRVRLAVRNAIVISATLVVMVAVFIATMTDGRAAGVIIESSPAIAIIVVLCLMSAGILGMQLLPVGRRLSVGYKPFVLASFLVVWLMATGWGRWLGVIAIPQDDPQYVELCHWAAANTDRDAVFIVPPGEQSMRLHGLRAVAVNFKNVPQLSDEMREWMRRMTVVLGEGGLADLPDRFDLALQTLDRRYDQRSATQLMAAASSLGARYVVTRTRLDELAECDITPPLPPHGETRFFLYDLARAEAGGQGARRVRATPMPGEQRVAFRAGALSPLQSS